MKALVAGGAGFIGSTLVDRLLAEGHAVDVIDDLSTGRLSNLADARSDRNADLKIHQVDVREREVVDLIERRAPEVVYQLAVVERDDPADDAVATVVGTLRLLEGARRAGARKVVLLVDRQVYGDVDVPAKESDAGAPVRAHGVAQLAAVEYLRQYRERWALDFTVLVADEVYGPRQAGGYVAEAAQTAIAGDALPAAPDDAPDLLFIDDVVDALDRAATRAGGLLLNLGWGRSVAFASVGAVIAEAAGTIGSAPRSSGGSGRALDAGRARIHLGWEPWTTLEEGVARLLRALHDATR